MLPFLTPALATKCLQVLALSTLLVQTRATEDAFMSSGAYNRGEFGHYITQAFRSSPVVAARPNYMIPYSNCDDGSKLFVALRGFKVAELAYQAAMIFDTNGDFIWAPEEEYGNTYNFQVQPYSGEPHLFFWAGDDGVKGHGKGHYYVFNKHYEHVQTISAGNGMYADLHTFAMTKNNTAICSIYNEKEHDLSAIAGRNYTIETIWDGIFQEINVETGDILFEWRASDHVSVAESYNEMYDVPEHPWNSKDDPWDWFHINMIEKDDAGNYLVSARHLRSLLYVDGRDGHVIWRLGGKLSDFTDLSGGKATGFVGQHDAHWADDSHTAITLFDNGRDWQIQVNRPSRGMRIEVDLVNMTASLGMIVTHPFAVIQSESQGSYQTLPNGNIVLGYGYNAVMTEFSPKGDLLCDAWWMPQGDFGTGNVQSYRNLKYDWVGLPKTPPSATFQDHKIYVSWLGATEVKMWTLYHSSNVSGTWEVALSFPKSGFETMFQLEETSAIRRYVRVVAFDKRGNTLGTSETLDIGDAATPSNSDPDAVLSDIYNDRPGPRALDIAVLSVAVVALTLAIAVLSMYAVRLCRRHRKSRRLSIFSRKAEWRPVPVDERHSENEGDYYDGPEEKIRYHHEFISSPALSMASSSSSKDSPVDELASKRWLTSLAKVLPAKFRPTEARTSREHDRQGGEAAEAKGLL